MDVDLHQWDGLVLSERVVEGNRNEVWRGVLDGSSVSIRRSRRSAASLHWELSFIHFLDRAGFRVATVIPTTTGRPSHEGVVVQRWLEGDEPTSADDWEAVSSALSRLHQATSTSSQRPGCCEVTDLTRARRSVDADLDALPEALAAELTAVFAMLPTVPTAAIHGDPNPSNIRISTDGVGFLDFDESRVDLVWHDLSNLGVQVLGDADHKLALDLSDAWETVNAWTTEPEYARHRLEKLRARRSM